MFDSWIHGLNTLFVASILYWAFAAWRELWIYRQIKESFRDITRLTHAPDAFDVEAIPDCLLAQGIYKNRPVAFRLRHITPTRLFYYRVDVHCHIEPDAKSKSVVSYKATALSESKRYFLTEKMSEQEILEILEETTHSIEVAESKSNP